ncbi:toll/interleukin-1 receptor domain-containing protein [Pseudomonas akapageensis]|uniref:toll/interleukin-1 receptor domain-containing protein n=1 Tax=Pseudomonas akapageensis TaxID=2609961 RepID=UPI00140AF0C2|nr:toll/interleukin-1 receptor domain-containing protein [Pseudomonas akapageensis]
MAFVGPPFAHDLFVSYSHGDDGTGVGVLQPWSAAFVKVLEQELRFDRQLRKDLKIFLDKDHRPGQGVDPMSPLTKQLRSQISESALLVILMSPDYLASTWCAEERNWWCEQQKQLGLALDQRIAVVKIYPTEPEPWPPPLVDEYGAPLVGFNFNASISGVIRPLGWLEAPGPFGLEFRQELLGIVGQLVPKLTALKARLDERLRSVAEASALAHAGGQTIYLHGRADQAQAWEKASLALTEKGYVVCPNNPDPVEDDPQKINEIREQRVETLCACDALMLLGTADGQALDADMVVIGKHDRQSARSRSNRLLPCGLLNTVGPAITTDERKANARIVQADWIDGTQANWPDQVQPWLLEKSAQLEPRP